MKLREAIDMLERKHKKELSRFLLINPRCIWDKNLKIEYNEIIRRQDQELEELLMKAESQDIEI